MSTIASISFIALARIFSMLSSRLPVKLAYNFSQSPVTAFVSLRHDDGVPQPLDLGVDETGVEANGL